MPLYKRNETWWIVLCHRGERIRRSTKTTDRTDAKRQHDELQARLWKEKRGGRHLSEALEAWLDKRPRSDKEKAALRQIVEAVTDVPLADVIPAVVEEALGIKGASRSNRLMAIVRAAMTIAKQKDWIDSVPHFPMREKVATDDTDRRALTPTEWKGLRKQLPAHLLDMADFSIATGLRWENVALLEWDRVSFARRQVLIPASMAKGKRLIAVPLSDEALAVLERVSDVDPVFCFTYDGHPITSPKTAWNKATKRAGLEGFVWHGLRHTWASWHAMAGTPLDVLQQLGAWRSFSMVERYKHLAPEYLAQYANNSMPQNLPHGSAKR